MFDQSVKRIGFACKYIEPNRKLSTKLLRMAEGRMNTKGVQVTWLQNQTKLACEERLWSTIHHNIQTIDNLIRYVSNLGPNFRMFRIGSDILPVYTHPDFQDFWKRNDVIEFCESRFMEIGILARKMDVRLSFHPGQFVVLASDRPEVVENSIREFEYHADMARWMGFGQEFQDFKINVHISGKNGPDGIKAILPRLSTEARNMITIENEEMVWGLDKVLQLKDDVAIVLDIHHHWLHSFGEYMYPTHDKFKMIMDSWRGVRPVIHYSISQDSYIKEYKEQKPNLIELKEAGVSRAKLRKHSDYYTNRYCNEWVADYIEYADIMCESKCKNLATVDLYHKLKEIKNDIFE